MIFKFFKVHKINVLHADIKIKHREKIVDIFSLNFTGSVELKILYQLVLTLFLCYSIISYR